VKIEIINSLLLDTPIQRKEKKYQFNHHHHHHQSVVIKEIFAIIKIKADCEIQKIVFSTFYQVSMVGRRQI
jgi:hypothetical protein